MKNRHHLTAWQAYADILMLFFAWAMVLVSLLLVFFHIKATEEKDYHPKAEIMIVLDWDDKRNVDLDLWLKNDSGDYVFYRNKEIGNIALDRDSRGEVTNRTMGPHGETQNSGNEEIISIRAFVPGDYTIAVTYYNDNTGGDADHNIDYTVKLLKVNPVVTQIAKVDGHMSMIKEVHKVLHFHVYADGKVEVLDDDPAPFLPEGQVP